MMKGIMIDCSRNAVMRVETFKKFVDVCVKMGYDTFMLYTEDTYEVENEPYFGYMRGRYSKEEIKDMDQYCGMKNVELIPCIQTLAHLNTIFKWWGEYECIRDCDDILFIGEERTYKLIDNMFKTVSKTYRTKKIHIGMDEAHMAGLGKYLEKYGYNKRFDIINKHLHTVCKIADKYGLEPMVWGDMFIKLVNNGNCSVADIEFIKNQTKLPENISLVYWDYYSKDYNHYKEMISMYKAFDRPVIFAGGAWTWKGFVPDNHFSIETAKPAIDACKDEKINDILITLWGDDGGECPREAVFPALAFIAALLNGRHEESCKDNFKNILGIDYDDFMLLDKLDTPNKELNGSPSKYLLYNDPFSGEIDYRIKTGVNEYYKDLKTQLESTESAYIFKAMFDFYISLCDVLSVKSELGVKTRKAYLLKDRKSITKLAENDYNETIEKLEQCHKLYQKLWFLENKPYGFEIQDIRLGGLIKRLESCRNRLLDYADDKIEEIPELEEKLLTGCDRGTSWARTVTANVISHFI